MIMNLPFGRWIIRITFSRKYNLFDDKELIQSLAIKK